MAGVEIKGTIVLERLLRAYQDKKYEGFVLPGGSRCFAEGTLARMDDGKLKKIEEIIPGDKVMGMDGKSPRTVLDTHSGIDDLFKVKQSRGIDYVVNSRHILTVNDKGKINDIELSEYKIHHKGIIKQNEKFINTEILIEHYGIGKYYGFSLLEEPHFLLEDGTVVHNSSKTFSIMQLVLLYCQENFNKGKRILFARQKYSDLKDTVMRDWFEMLIKYGIYQEKNHFRSNPQSYQLYGNMIYFRGLDAGGAHGEAYDVFWINEAFESEEEPFFQLDLRLRKGGFFFLDYNPYFTEHWILDKVNKRPEVWVSPTSTIIDNPFMIGSREYGRVMSLDPSNPVNVRNGTADDALWQIYGLGIGASITGVIYTNVTWIEKFPENLDYWYGADLGFVNDPTTIIKTAIDGNNLYWEERFYNPVDNPKALSMAMDAAGIERHIPINCDSSDKYISAKYGSMEMVKDLRELGWNIQKVSKVNDIVFWIGKIKEMNIHIVQTYTMSDGTVKVTHFQEERQKYKWKTINGSSVNQPIDAYNHCLDGGRYGFMMNKKRQSKRHFWN